MCSLCACANADALPKLCWRLEFSSDSVFGRVERSSRLTQVELNEQELNQLIQLITMDMVAEAAKQPPAVDFTATLHPLAMKLHAARHDEIMWGKK